MIGLKESIYPKDETEVIFDKLRGELRQYSFAYAKSEKHKKNYQKQIQDLNNILRNQMGFAQISSLKDENDQIEPPNKISRYR
jgi:hypothetical protein